MTDNPGTPDALSSLADGRIGSNHDDERTDTELSAAIGICAAAAASIVLWASIISLLHELML